MLFQRFPGLDQASSLKNPMLSSPEPLRSVLDNYPEQHPSRFQGMPGRSAFAGILVSWRPASRPAASLAVRSGRNIPPTARTAAVSGAWLALRPLAAIVALCPWIRQDAV